MNIQSFLKTNALAIMALIFAGSLMSFKLAENNTADQNFYYISEDMSEGAFHDVNNWTSAESCLLFLRIGESLPVIPALLLLSIVLAQV